MQRLAVTIAMVLMISAKAGALDLPKKPQSGDTYVHNVVTEGLVVGAKEWPFNYAVGIHFETSNGLIECSGILVSPTQVVTAGHCTEGKGSARINMQFSKFGAPRFQSGQVSKTERSGDTDLGLITLDAPAEGYSGEFPKIAEGPCDEGSPYELIAYGLDQFGETQLNPKRAIYHDRERETKGSLLLQSKDPKTGRACSSDSGGPIFCKVNGKWVIAGILSSGRVGIFKKIMGQLKLISQPKICSGTEGIRATRMSSHSHLFSEWLETKKPDTSRAEGAKGSQ